MSKLRSVAAVLMMAAGLGACETGTDPEDRIPARVAVVDGSGQQGTAGQPLANPVRVRVEDERGRPVPGKSVNFVVTGGGGTVSVATATSDDDGIASAQWTLGTVAGSAQTLEARVAAPSGQAIVSDPVTATVRAGAAARIEPAGPTFNMGAAVGSAVADSLALRVLDAFGNPVQGATVTWSIVAGDGTVPASSTTGASGVARALWTLGQQTGVVHVARASVAGVGTQDYAARAGNLLTVLRPVGVTASGGTTIEAAVGLAGAAGEVPGARVQWQVVSGGGTVNPAQSRTGRYQTSGEVAGVATTQWTLGPGGGTQTLRATSGTLQVTISVNVIAQGTRQLVAQVPGQVIDAAADRVLWLDTSGGNRLVKIRTIATGTDVTVKSDTVHNPNFPHLVHGYLFNGGTLVWSTSGELFDYRNGTLTGLGPFEGNTGGFVSTEGRWAAWSNGSTVFRRDLDAGTNLTVGSGARPDVGADGDVVFLGGGGPWLYSGGTATPVSTEGPPVVVATDGVNVVYITVTNTFTTSTLWLEQGSGDVALTGHSHRTGGLIYYRLNGGWIAYSTPLAPVFRRAPDGTVTRITTETNATRVEALAPDGTLIYHHPTPNGRYYLVTPDGTRYDVGPAADGERAVWRGDRFLLLSGGSVYRLAP